MRRNVKLEVGHWGGREYRAVLLPWWTAPSVVEDLSAALASLLNRTVFPVGSGRGALALALSILAARNPRRRYVIIPEYICPAVPAVIESLGLECAPVPVRADLNIDTNTVLQRLNHDVLAVMQVHMYGNMLDNSEIEQATEDAGAQLIDNAAHAAGVSGEAGYIPGTRGAFGILSFAQSKSIVCGHSGSGGALIVNEKRYDQAVSALTSKLKTQQGPKSLWFALLDRNISAEDRLWRIKQIHRKYHQRAGDRERFFGKIAPIHAAIAIEQIRTLQERIDDKKRVMELYWNHVKDIPDIAFPQYVPGRYLTRAMFELTSIKQRDRLRCRLSRRGIATRLGYPPLDLEDVDIGRSARPLLEVPSGFGLSSSEIEFISTQMRG